MKTIALYGGSFDPPHIAHEAIVSSLNRLDFLDKVIVMPTYLNPFKERFSAPAELRLEWLKKIFSEYENVEIDAYEVEQKRKVPTIESVNHLLKKYDKIYLVIGADNLDSLHKWHRYDELKKRVSFIVASRNDIEIPKDFMQLKIDKDISSCELRKNLDINKLPKKCAKEIAHYYKEHNANKN